MHVHPELARLLHLVKQLQEQHFRSTYADLLASPTYGPAAQFFLSELYGARDFSGRDDQFARIAGTLTAVFPSDVADTAVILAELHLLTEELDMEMARAWPSAGTSTLTPEECYVQAWRTVARPDDRRLQLGKVLNVARSLARLTRLPGLRMMLRLMRTPAERAGLADLQRFLETGFDRFHTLCQTTGALDDFLRVIENRESTFMQGLFNEAPSDVVRRYPKSAMQTAP